MSWVLDDEIGHGALGRVVRVRNRLTGEVLAGKILHASHRDDAGAVARFGREAELLHSIDHPNLVDVRGLEVIDGEQVLLMELIEGPSLAQLIAREGVLPEARVVAIGKGMAAGLQAAHRAGLVHRDLKPANVLVAPGDVAKIVDFGLARATSFAGVDRRNLALVGTPDYMAPESADPLAIDPRSDLYSLGCILYEMMAGHPPYGGATPFAVLQAHIDEPLPELEAGPERSEALVRLVHALLAKSPADRPQSAAQVAQDLAAVHGLAAVVAGTLARAGACARCGAPLLDDVPVCFGCAMEQGTVEVGPGTVWVTGPGKSTHKLDSGLREVLLDWIRSSPQLGLDPSQLAREVPRLPFVLVAGVSEASARRLVSSVTALGLTAEWRAGHRFSLVEMRRKAWSLSGRILAIAAGTMAIFNQMVLRVPGALIAAIALVPVAAVAGGWRLAGRAATRLQAGTRGALPPALRERIDRLVDLVPAIEARRHRESLRGAVQRVLALRASVPEAERARIEPELAHVLDLAMAAAARIDELERRLAVADLRETDAAARRDLRERDAWAARLLETSAQLDALRARWAAARASDGEADETLDQLRAQVAAFEEVGAL
jgi:hypothetical protein